MQKKLLVVVDMQKDFIDGALGTKEAEAIVENVLELMQQYPNENIYATKDTHFADYLNTQEGKYLPVPHCIKDSEGWQFDRRLARLYETHVIEKTIFGSEALVHLLQERAQNENIAIMIVGLCTDICVVSNAIMLKNNLPDVEISVKAACCAGVTPQTHEAALQTMKMCQIQVV